MSEITFYAKKKLNDYMALVLETHVQPKQEFVSRLTKIRTALTKQQ